ncbi:GNAT family N-acetyltransferase [Chitinophaga sp.]|uniref:GNAT family N-acetyltransferase n=1 Tax=Chitinophaga sp. TaxID=1869181 RepID=UPI002CC32AD4|nr:GNAT family N-acetyltransferase [Chitinophaga sp.]HWV67454.1 GNAT family N-acetyltransferase [Chitinophaga sp.]
MLLPSGNYRWPAITSFATVLSPVYPANQAYIRRLGVHPAYRGRAIARHLMEMCIKEARAGAEHIPGLYASTIMPDARHLYEQFGFLQIKELAPLFGQQYWLYRLDLRQ